MYAVNQSRLLEQLLREQGWDAWDPQSGGAADFAMWDSQTRYGPRCGGPPAAALRCLDPRDTYFADNKRQLWFATRRQCRGVLPETYTDAAEAERALGGAEPRGAVWFLKRENGAGGEGVVVGRLADMLARWRAEERPSCWLLQRGVPCGALAGGRKVTLRVYVLWLPSGAAALWEEGLAIVHSAPLDGAAAECRAAHVDHQGCERRRLSREPYAPQVWAPLREAAGLVFGCFRRTLNTERDPTRFHLFGADFVLAGDSSGAPRPVLIEVNSHPNLSAASCPVGRAVKRELFDDLRGFLIDPVCRGAAPRPGRWRAVLDPR